MIEELRAVLNSVGDLPPMPPVASRVLTLIGDGTATAKDLAAAVATDPAVAAQLLKIANSAYYSLPRRVKTLDHAIVVMGEKALRSLVITACLKGLHKSYGPVEKMLWEDAVGCAVASRLLAGRLRLADPEEAFLGGLFRNLGKLVMNNRDPVKYRKMLQQVDRDELSIDTLEQACFSYSHMLIGAAVLAKWKFPEHLTYVVRYYRSLVQTGEGPCDFEGLLATVNIADAFCRKHGIGRNQPELALALGDVPGAVLLHVDEARLADIYGEFVEVFERDRAIIFA